MRSKPFPITIHIFKMSTSKLKYPALKNCVRILTEGYTYYRKFTLERVVVIIILRTYKYIAVSAYGSPYINVTGNSSLISATAQVTRNI